MGGNYYILAMVDSNRWINESNEDNNTNYYYPIAINRLAPDLIVTSVTGPASANSEDWITVTANIRNQGEARTGGGFTVSFVLSPDAVWGNGNDIGLGGTYYGDCIYGCELPAGADGTVTMGVKLPYNMGGEYYIIALVDANYWINESNEDNNTNYYYPIAINRLAPDLIVTSVTGPASANSEDIITVTANIRNQGEARTGGGFTVSFVLSPDAVLGNGNDIGLGGTYYGDCIYGCELPAGADGTVTMGVKLPYNMGGEYYIIALVDANYWINESNEDNNTNWYEIFIGNRPPVSNAGTDQVFECQAILPVEVQLDGSGSTDPDNDVLTYEWTWVTSDGITHTSAEVNPIIALPEWGTYTIALTVTDPYGLESSDTVQITVGDTKPPVTTATVMGKKSETDPEQELYISAVTVHLESTDACTGVRELHYTIEKDGVIIEDVTVLGNPETGKAKAVMTLIDDGTYRITYWSVDNAGVTGNVVTTPVNATPSSSSGGGYIEGHYTECINVDLQSVDTPEGQVLKYSLDGGITWNNYDGSFPYCQEGTTQVLYGYAQPTANVENPQVLIIKIDRLGPHIVITGVENGVTYALGFVPKEGYTATDEGSGIASSSGSLTGGDGYGLGAFTYTVTATDNVGRTETTSVTYNVIATIPGLIELVNQYRASGEITDQEMADTLLLSLNNALNAPNANEQDGYMQDFRYKVEAQSGKKITANVAAILIHAADYVISHN